MIVCMKGICALLLCLYLHCGLAVGSYGGPAANILAGGMKVGLG